ncbi:MAG: DUF4392 domain-containing protein [SAR202 cluster bacterium]|nr:DUF4392 domain-containing protein [SAR202 cluster bacterium]|tara:strand:+ start:3855 stop:4709 length:855 start_codon:yes stop_codon:yes gene_type:complete
MGSDLTIEDIILSNDQRGISELRDLVPADYCTRAAELILANTGTILITTGFYILSAGAAETDGPPGAIAIGVGLERLGYKVKYVADEHSSNLLRPYVAESSDVIDFPITTLPKSVQYAEDILNTENPSVLISIERCAAAADGLYRNMRDLDISDQTAKVDLLFDMHSKTIGIGDGGNEIGLGNVIDGVAKSETLVSYPTVSKVTELIIASVSNWGGYGLLAALSISTGKNVLPTVEEDTERISKMVDLGAVDGFSGEEIYKVDGFDLTENAALLEKLHELVNGH